MKAIKYLVAILVIALLLGCVKPEPAPEPAVTTEEPVVTTEEPEPEVTEKGEVILGELILIQENGFNPKDKTISVGDTLTWQNAVEGVNAIVQNIGGTEFKSPVLQPGDIFSHTFETPGEFRVMNLNRKTTQGTITVE